MKGIFDCLLFEISIEIHKETVLPRFTLNRSGFNTCHIQPIKNILLQLKNCAKTAEIIVDVVIDRTSQNCIDPCLSLNKQLLDRLAQEVSDSDNCVVINYQTVDSKES